MTGDQGLLLLVILFFMGYVAFVLKEIVDELKLHRELNWGRLRGGEDSE